MEPQPVPTGPPPASPEASPPQSFWHKYRMFLIIIVAFLLAAAGAAVWARGSTKPANTSATQSVAPPAKKTAAAAPTAQVNTWQGEPVSASAIPLGDGKVSTSPQTGYVDSCTSNFKGGGARHTGSWINSSNNTWDSTSKLAVEGANYWPAASYTDTVSGNSRVLATNDLPETYPTGNFPITRSDPAYQYDTNPNSVGTQSLNYSLPLNPTAAAAPSCVPLGPIGVLSDGVVLFNGLDDAGRDAVAHETQDSCNGHPDQQEMYHYHDVPSCIRDKATGSSTLVGYALDGYGIYVERDAQGNLPTNADLDACHGRTSEVEWNGRLTAIYHYDATLEYPYTLGCFHGTPVVR